MWKRIFLYGVLMVNVLFASQKNEMIIRISEIEVAKEYLKEYLDFAQEVGAISVREESGVVCIFPMIQKRDSTQIRILEIYENEAAYKKHITTEHFLKYKKGTLHMVKKLDLVDMHAMNPKGMHEIFQKMKINKQ